MKRLLIALSIGALAAIGSFAFAGFDEFGYNRTARIFNGNAWDWCMEKVADETWCESYLGDYADDKLIMKWNAEWDRGNDENWTIGPYDAWINNEWNGMKDGSGSVWHYKIAWDEGCANSATPSIEGGYCIWGDFVMLMDQGMDDSVHYWIAHTTPNGYGVLP